MKMDEKTISLLMRIPEKLSDEGRNQISREYSALGRQAFYDEASERKILPFIAHSLSSLNLDKKYWANIHDESERRNKRIIDFLDVVFDELAKENCKTPCLNENMGALLSSKACIGCFTSNDVDISIDKGEVDKVYKVMEKMGIPFDKRKMKSNRYSTIEFDCSDKIDSKFWLNFSWMPTSRPKSTLCDQRRTAKRLDEQRRVAVNYKDTSIRILDNDAMVYFCSLHIASCHFFSMMPAIRLYVDIDRPVCNNVINWERIKKWAFEDQVGIRIDVVLYLCKQLLGTDIPLSITDINVKSRYFDRVLKRVYNSNSHGLIRPSNAVHTRIHQLIVELSSDGRNPVIALLSRL